VNSSGRTNNGDDPASTRTLPVAAPIGQGTLGRADTTEPIVVQTRRERRKTKADARTTQKKRKRRIIRRVIVIALIAFLIPTGWSYYRALSAPGTDPWTVRSVEWLKDHGLNGAVNWFEHWWYTHHTPPVGGKPTHGLPRTQKLDGSAAPVKKKSTAPTTATTGVPPPPPHLPPPAQMQPLVASPLPNEGVWTPTGHEVAGVPAVYTAFLRPDPIHTSLVAAAMWMDTTLLKTVFVAGLQQPGGPSPWGAQVPPQLQPSLIAAFNSGFKINDSRGGYYNDGQTYRALVDGAASLVIDKQGKATVVQWGRDMAMSPNIQTVRQNLALMIDGGQPVPGLNSDSNAKWGATLGARVLVWRSGVGVDANGGLIYVAGPGLSVQSLAILLQRAGAVRAMELDINSAWVSAYTYAGGTLADPVPVHGVKLLPDMTRSDDRYLVAGERDFFALFANR
jgi:hypothetical protein